MLVKNSMLMRISKFLKELAPNIAKANCAFLFIGEPKLPEKLKEIN